MRQAGRALVTRLLSAGRQHLSVSVLQACVALCALMITRTQFTLACGLLITLCSHRSFLTEPSPAIRCLDGSTPGGLRRAWHVPLGKNRAGFAPRSGTYSAREGAPCLCLKGHFRPPAAGGGPGHHSPEKPPGFCFHLILSCPPHSGSLTSVWVFPVTYLSSRGPDGSHQMDDSPLHAHCGRFPVHRPCLAATLASRAPRERGSFCLRLEKQPLVSASFRYLIVSTFK